MNIIFADKMLSSLEIIPSNTTKVGLLLIENSQTMACTFAIQEKTYQE